MTDRDGVDIVTGGNKAGSNGVGGKDRSEGTIEAGRGMLCGCSADSPAELVNDLTEGIGEGEGAIPGNDSSDPREVKGICGVDSADGIRAAVTYSEGGTGSDTVRYSVEAAFEGRVLAVL